MRRSVLDIRNAFSVSHADYTQRAHFYIPRLTAYSGGYGAAGTGTLVPSAPRRLLRRRAMYPVKDDAVPPRPKLPRSIASRWSSCGMLFRKRPGTEPCRPWVAWSGNTFTKRQYDRRWTMTAT